MSKVFSREVLSQIKLYIVPFVPSINLRKYNSWFQRGRHVSEIIFFFFLKKVLLLVLTDISQKAIPERTHIIFSFLQK